jgi:hypothetical protein
MAYSKATFKSNGDKASPCFKPFLMGNDRQTFAFPESAISFSQTFFIILASLIGIPHSTRISHKVSLLTETRANK